MAEPDFITHTGGGKHRQRFVAVAVLTGAASVLLLGVYAGTGAEWQPAAMMVGLIWASLVAAAWFMFVRPLVQLTRPDAPSVLLPKLLAEMNAPIFYKDMNFKYIGCNEAFERLTGLGRADIIGRTVHEVTDKNLADKHMEADIALMKSGGRVEYEARVETPDGRQMDVIFYKSVYRDASGNKAGIVVAMIDITQRRELEDRLRHDSRHDGLTGLVNRGYFMERLAEAIRDAGQRKKIAAVIFIDLDGFKSVNDTHGHVTGDAVLVEVARRLRSVVRDEDDVARLGGDEFTILLSGLETQAPVSAVLNRIEQAMRPSFPVPPPHEHIGYSVGHAIYPVNAASPDELLRSADAAMYAGKSGRKPQEVPWRRDAANLS